MDRPEASPATGTGGAWGGACGGSGAAGPRRGWE